MFSAFDIFKIGLGPSSSHTVGPMRAARRFLLDAGEDVMRARAVSVSLEGSLAWTGEGHGTDRAVILGLSGAEPDSIDPDEAAAIAARVRTTHRLPLLGEHEIVFDPDQAIRYDRMAKPPAHPNTMAFALAGADGAVLASERWCSVGGGFVLREADVLAPAPAPQASVPYPFASARDLLEAAAEAGLTVPQLVRANEESLRTRADVDAHLDRVVETMMGCIDRGLATDGILPGRLGVARRAPNLTRRLRADRGSNVLAPIPAMDWVSVYAIAVNEENAAGGRVVTAPTNGAAGVVPAVLRHYRDELPGATREGMHDFLLTAAAIASLFKLNASISGAEVGCQGEVGVASSMAAAGLAAALDAPAAAIENAAEIGMEHHLGMTCDPVGGLVQIPCIERNAFGAVKAINAAMLAMRGDGKHHVTLDQVIKTMRETGADMQSKYKETSLGGLAVNFVEC